MTDLETLMKAVILPELSSIPDAATHVDRLLNLEKFAKKVLGKIHCEDKVTATLRPLLSVIISTTSPFFIEVFSVEF